MYALLTQRALMRTTQFHYAPQDAAFNRNLQRASVEESEPRRRPRSRGRR